MYKVRYLTDEHEYIQIIDPCLGERHFYIQDLDLSNQVQFLTDENRIADLFHKVKSSKNLTDENRIADLFHKVKSSKNY